MNYKSLSGNTAFKLFTFAFFLFSCKTGFSQEENNLKNFRFGLKATPTISWYKPDDKKKLNGAGARFKFGYGLITEFRLSNVAVFATGLQVDYDGGRLSFIDSAYYFFAQDEIISVKDTAGRNAEQYRLISREYNVTYVTLPLTLKMKTKEIGMLTYFGQFGLNTSFRVKARVNDELVSEAKNTADQSDLNMGDDMNLFKFALNVGAGAEYNLSGSTSIVFGLNYLNGFSNVLKNESRYLQKGKKDQTAFKQKATSNGIVITVGILF